MLNTIFGATKLQPILRHASWVLLHIIEVLHLRHKVDMHEVLLWSAAAIWVAENCMCNVHQSKSVTRVFAPSQAHLRNLFSRVAT